MYSEKRLEMNRNPARVLSSQALSVLNEGIGLVLSRWTALQAAVENEWGGRDSRQKAERAVSDIFSWFAQSKEHYIDDLETILEEALMELNTMVDDGSIEEVAYQLMCLHEECLEGNYQTAEKLRVANSQMTTRAKVVKDPNGDDCEDSDGEGGNDCVGNGHNTNMMVDGTERQSGSSPAEDMPIDEPMPKPVAEAEDGWTVVSTKRTKGRRN